MIKLFLKIQITLVITVCLLLSFQSFAQQEHKSYVIKENTVIVYPNEKLAGNAKAIRLQVMNDHIIRVTASPSKDIAEKESLVVIQTPGTAKWEAKEADGKLILATAAIKAIVDISNGAVSFTDLAGNTIIAERAITGRSIASVLLEGEPLYAVRQTFETAADDAYYGLGQHQDDVWNYKGKQVVFFQNNTEVAVPFLVSVKNYGILWDNYSYSKAGDVRPYQTLSALKLYDRNIVEGWLTASYANDRNKPKDIAFEKAESDIDYPFLNDSKLKLPREFAVDKGMITWQGSIASNAEGIHQFKFTYAGYIKLYIDGKLLLDKWRQAWNPGTGLADFLFEKGKKYPIKIEWIPDGGESYLTAGFLPPALEQDKHTFTFDSEAGREIDYYFVHGKSMDDVIHGYRQLTGKATIVPKWAMGFWQSRERYKTQDELLDVVAEFRKRRIPLDNIVLDWSYWKEDDWGSQEFDAARFPNPDSMIGVLHKKYNTQVMISVWPKFYEGITAFKQFDAKGWLYKRTIAEPHKDWVGKGYVSTFYDVFNEDARKGFWKLIHDKIYVKGIDAWWMDASEPDILSNSSVTERKKQMSPTALGTAAEYLNAYPLQNAKGIYEGQRSVDANKRVFLLTRSGFAGSQRYGATIWSGDIASRWEDMRTQISAGLNFSISGLPYWTMDIGGFSVEKRFEKPNEADQAEWRELQTRWFQFGAFVPLFRAHGQFPFREIYNIAPETHPAYQSMLYYNKLRYRLMPYIYSLAGHAYHHDYTIMRGLVMDFNNDTAVQRIGDQFMFGSSLLISPVYTYKATSRSLYLPAGQGWYDLYTGKYNEGGKKITVDAPYERTPVFVKEGSIIPTGPDIQYTAEKPADPITLYVYAGKDASFTLYEDENGNYNYERGAFAEIPISYNEQNSSITIGERKGKFQGMIKTRTFNVKLINKNSPAAMDFNAVMLTTIKYSGKMLTRKL
ncbi:MAG TPA: glycoside hydrolase family 31 protein [Ferruginibacter sp.]|nr:glycoside hydrolase family 31 protein [Ferruginibacter sp.]